jgi:hypothetical protein
MHTSKLRYTLLSLLLCLAATPVLAHEHQDDVSEEELNAPVDAILWIHMFLQAAVWGFLFPVGMVLGLSRSRWHVPLQVRTETRLAIRIRSRQLTCWVPTEHGYRVNDRRVLPWTHARWSKISRVCPRDVCEHRHDIRRCAARPRDLPQASHSRKVDTTVCCCATWDHWESIPYYRLDPDVIWSDRVHGLL